MRLLLLAGTGEARQLAEALALRGADAVASLAGATATPLVLAVPTRVGGFGGAEGFATYLRDAGIGAVLDATHPFAARISARSAEVCAALGLPYLQVLRPEWQPGAGDHWASLGRLEDAGQVIPTGAAVFAATGRHSAGALDLPGRSLHIRVIDRPEGAFPFAKGSYVVGRAPFTEADEIALLRRLGVDWVLTKNAGGAAGLPKLQAARALGLPVAMVQRPPPAGPSVPDVAGALAWTEALT